MKMFCFACLSGLVCVSSGLAQTATHDRPLWCPRASTVTEQVICSDPVLSQLDFKLTEVFVYWKDRMQGDEKVAFRSRQRDWLGYRDSCGSDLMCIEDAYKWRLETLGF